MYLHYARHCTRHCNYCGECKIYYLVFLQAYRLWKGDSNKIVKPVIVESKVRGAMSCVALESGNLVYSGVIKCFEDRKNIVILVEKSLIFNVYGECKLPLNNVSFSWSGPFSMVYGELGFLGV